MSGWRESVVGVRVVSEKCVAAAHPLLADVGDVARHKVGGRARAAEPDALGVSRHSEEDPSSARRLHHAGGAVAAAEAVLSRHPSEFEGGLAVRRRRRLLARPHAERLLLR